MDQHSSDISGALPGDTKALEASLRALWERARHVGETIAQLRDEKKMLQAKVRQLEHELQGLRQEFAEKEALISKQASELAHATPTNGTVVLNGEREQLAVRVRDLLTRLDAYL